MSGLPKSIIQKYGVSKKAWAVFRSRKRTTQTVRPRRPRPSIKRRVSMARKSYKRYSRALKPTNTMIGAVAYGLLEPTINSFAGKLGMGVSDDIVKGVGGYLLAKRGGLIGGIGQAALTISVYKLAASRGGLLSATQTGTAVTTFGTGATF